MMATNILFLAAALFASSSITFIYGEPDSLWEMDEFLSQQMPDIEALAGQKLDPMVNFPIFPVNLSFTGLMNIEGNLRNVKFEGARGFQFNYSYSSPSLYFIRMTANYPTTVLYGRHNISGTVTRNNGSLVPIGGGEDRLFRLETTNAISSHQFHIEIEDDRRVKMAANAEILSMNLNPYDLPGVWTMDMGGLLDPIRNDPELLQSVEHWMAMQILEYTKVPFDSLEKFVAKRIEKVYLKVLKEAFRTITIDDILRIKPDPNTTTVTPHRNWRQFFL